MLVIRLTKVGAKKRPFFRVVVTEKATARDGQAVEILGFYDPRRNPERLELDRARLSHWLSAGARPSDTVRTLIARHPAPVESQPVAS
ncbi:MAG: 30S ribosomal protein S16 [Vicinamibacterales bacterium]